MQAPTDAVATGGAFAYPADGSVARVGSVTAGAFAVPGATPSASANSEAQGVTLFNGEITATTVTAKVKANAGRRARPATASARRWSV